MAKKWIIEGRDFKLGNVDFHREFAKDKSKVIGGGYWHIDRVSNILYLYSKSEDFGNVSLADIIRIKHSGFYSLSLEKLEWRFSKEDSLDRALVLNEKI